MIATLYVIINIFIYAWEPHLYDFVDVSNGVRCLHIYKSKEVGKDQGWIQSSITSGPGHHKENYKNTRKHHIHESQGVS